MAAAAVLAALARRLARQRASSAGAALRQLQLWASGTSTSPAALPHVAQLRCFCSAAAAAFARDGTLMQHANSSSLQGIFKEKQARSLDDQPPLKRRRPTKRSVFLHDRKSDRDVSDLVHEGDAVRRASDTEWLSGRDVVFEPGKNKSRVWTFNDLKVPSHIAGKLPKMGISQPTAVQVAAVPRVMAGRDVLLQGVTGSGKTLAYLLPLFAHLDVYTLTLQAIIVMPTRELAIQVMDVARNFLKGGSKKRRQFPVMARRLCGLPTAAMIQNLKDHPPHLIIATPHTLAAVLARKALDLRTVRLFVMDEVDYLMQHDPKEHLDAIMQHLVKAQSKLLEGDYVRAQRVLVTASITQEVKDYAAEHLADAREIIIVNDASTGSNLPSTIKQLAIPCEDEASKPAQLRRLLSALQPRAMLVFTNSVADALLLEKDMTTHGFRACAFTSEIRKEQRASLLDRIGARGSDGLQVLVATDMVARGLDLHRLTHVVLYHLPKDRRWYLHRVGRVGRVVPSEEGPKLQEGVVASLCVGNSQLRQVVRWGKQLGSEVHTFDVLKVLQETLPGTPVALPK
eukprot:jgi/Chlat1/5244/Chrsp33S05085